MPPMTLASGTKLGPYEIVSPLGAGGMGEVYRARDTRLDRNVAIKILPSTFSADSDRLHRFQHEARVLSALNHPNLLAIYDVGTQDETYYFVSELLEGESLRQRLGEGPLSLRKAVDYGVQMAKGLAAAHEKGIVHRDLKPDNIFVTKDGRVKILDFGLAKQATGMSASGESATMTCPTPTAPGTVMGTVGYMSPEQVRGQTVDHRCDIFSFGAILYELVAGQRAFKGASSVETMNAILKEDPPEVSTTNKNIPPTIDRLIRLCLEKVPEERFQSAHDLAFALDAVSGTTATSGAQAVVDTRPHKRRWLWPAAAILWPLMLVTAAWLWFGAEPYGNPQFQQLTFQRGIISRARFTPDGQSVVYSASWAGGPYELYATRPGSNESRPLGAQQAQLVGVSTGGEMAILLHWHQVYYWVSVGTLARMPVDGGRPREVLDDVNDADIAPDGQQFAVVRTNRNRERLEFPIGQVLYETNGYISHPRISPDGEMVAFDDHPLFGDDRGFVAVVDKRRNVRRITREWSTIQGLAWAKSGREIWFAAGGDTGLRSLYAVSVAGKLRLLWRVPADFNLYDTAPDGRVLAAMENKHGEILAGLAGQSDRDLSWLDWDIAPYLSPDNKTVFFTDVGQSVGTDYAVFMRQMDGSPAVRLGVGGISSVSRSGKWVLTQLPSQPNKFLLLPTGAGEVRTLEASGLVLQILESEWMPEDDGFYFVAAEPGHQQRTFRMLLDGSKPVAVTEEGYAGVVLSPDGKTLVVRDPEGQLFLYQFASGEPHPLPGGKPGERCLSWDEGGQGLYLTSGFEFPAVIEHLDLATGRRQVWKSIKPSDMAGAEHPSISLTRKGEYVYSLLRVLSDLYVIERLR